MDNNIGNNAVLLGENNSTTCVVSSDGEDNYFRANCIYFVDDMYPRDIGVLLHDFTMYSTASTAFTTLDNVYKSKLASGLIRV